MTGFRILGICGSLRRGSFNLAALRAAVDLAPEGISLEIALIGEIPLFNDDVRAVGIPAPVIELAGRIVAADAVLIATPEYNYSIPGVLKNAIDWVSRCDPQPFRDKAVAIMGASPGAIGTARAQYDLRKVFVFLDAHVMNKPEIMISAAGQRFDGAGVLTDAATRQLIGQQLAALRDWAMRLRS
ncbi:NAD(P)H-dependent oxidoreductase [Acidiphilium sp. AL]|uniref:NADPH-dependent FMN reductase n=1 Tax=Acidiphilium sp. AL TaxID=2871704 RepID=UPI0021CAFEEE|nr:NADPH-dependent FMN reductase [Acidiphilium sp. AL]MCU4160882.1 NAD(P)H-dependent oxidoreductase [Acidiphilium sp. AL]